MRFKYKAHRPGEDVLLKGEREALDKFDLSREMREEGFVLVEARPVEVSKKFNLASLNEVFIRIKLHDKVIFANNLSAMVSAGFSLSRALGVLLKQTTNPKFKRVLTGLANSIDSGKSFNASLAEYPDVFPPVFVAMVSSGEESGKLAEALKIVGDELGKSYALRRKVRGALAYPVVVLVAMVIVAVLMMVYVVPNLSATFREFNVPLPLATQVIMGTSDAFVNHGLWLFVAFVVTLLVSYKFFRTERGRRLADYLILRLPVLGIIVKEMDTAVAARTLSSLISSGVSMVKAISITESVVSNSYYKDILREARSGVEKGATLSSFFVNNKTLFPILAGELVEVGEETGRLSSMLEDVATFYEGEVDNITKDMSSIIEPVLMVVIGVFVGFFAISIIQPIYSITSAI